MSSWPVGMCGEERQHLLLWRDLAYTVGRNTTTKAIIR